VLKCEPLHTRTAEAAITIYLAFISAQRHGDLSQEHAEQLINVQIGDSFRGKAQKTALARFPIARVNKTEGG